MLSLHPIIIITTTSADCVTCIWVIFHLYTVTWCFKKRGGVLKGCFLCSVLNEKLHCRAKYSTAEYTVSLTHTHKHTINQENKTWLISDEGEGIRRTRHQR